MRSVPPAALCLCLVLTWACPTPAADWPMWRHDAGRGNATPENLPAQLWPHWVRELPTPRPAWPDTQARLRFDEVPQPVAAGGRIFVPCTANDAVTAYDAATGKELWRFCADGPVRFAPVAHEGRVHFISDDGHLYTVDAASGRLLWKLNGGPAERRVIGNDRLVSAWPARGGVVLHRGRLYFAASVWPFMGVFVHAVDPETGRVLWTNSGDGTNFVIHPHGAPAFGTVVPQGHLAATGDHVVVPGGRSTPAVYDADTGRLVHFQFDARNGGHAVLASGPAYFVGGNAYQAADGVRVGSAEPALADDRWVISSLGGGEVRVETGPPVISQKVKLDRRGKKTIEAKLASKSVARLTLDDCPGEVFLLAGSRLYAGGESAVAAYELGDQPRDEATLRPAWSGKIDGEAHHLFAAADRLFVMTKDARLYCFGAGERETVRHSPGKALLPARNGEWQRHVAGLVAGLERADGYAVAVGLGSGRLVEELLRQSQFHVIVLDPDADKVAAFRRQWQDAGLYGERVAVHHGDPAHFALPPYLARLIVSEEPATFAGADGAKRARHLYPVLRPYGGVLALRPGAEDRPILAALQQAADGDPQAKIEHRDGVTLLKREGALPGSGSWTHQYGDAAQTSVSADKLVKAPLGVLWFGGPSNDKVLPRHGHGPAPQVAGGRLFIEGPDMLRAVDVYTGRLLWEKELKDFGKYYDTTKHFAGAGEIGSNYVSLPDRVYAVHGDALLELDAATGELVRDYRLPAERGKEPPFWGWLAVDGDCLIATSSPVDAGLPREEEPKAVPAGAEPVVPPGAKWQYLADRDPGGLDWAKPSFTSKGWKTGKASFGFDKKDGTVLPTEGEFPRVYIRHAFDGASLRGAEEVELSIRYDDGFIAYLNGVEFARGAVRKGRGAEADGVSSHSATRFEYFPVANWKKLLRPGENVLAIEGHNVDLDSDDLTLDPALVVYRKPKVAAQPKPDPSKTAAGKLPELPEARYAAGSRRLVVYDRHTGQLLWERTARFTFRHNSICAGGGKLFCIDGLTDQRKQALARRGLPVTVTPTLYALDLRTGAVAWSTNENVFGTFLNYSAEHDLLLQGGSSYRDRAKDEVARGLAAYRGRDGLVLWHNADVSYGGPCLLWHDKIVTNGLGGFAVDLKTGEPTGWKYYRKYGCNTAVGGEHLLTFRSGCAGYFDLEGDSGTGNLGGFRSGCTNNLLIADGVLSAPDYTRTCTCTYQNQTSLALIHTPDAEFWTFGGTARADRVGVNLGAPGDRRGPDGTLWQSAPEELEVEPKEPRAFRTHSSLVTGAEPRWVTGNGLEGVRKVRVPVEEGTKLKVRLYFLEPDAVAPGERVFDVKLQGEVVLRALDVARAAGARHCGIARDFTATASGGFVEVELEPRSDRPPVLSGIQLLRE